MEPAPLPPLASEIQDLQFSNLKVLSLKSCKMSFARLMLLKGGFPALEELVLSQNNCSDFEAIEIAEGDFSALKSLDLSLNRINSEHSTQHLNKFPALENLNLTGNLLTNLVNVSQLGRLKALNLHQNQIKDVWFVNDLAKMTCIESLRISDNPVLDSADPVHVKYLAIASLPNIKIANGTPMKPYEVKDCQIYYWKNPYHEYFLENDRTHHNFIFSKFYKWARRSYAMFDFYLQKFDTAYDCEKQPDHRLFLEMRDEELDEATAKVQSEAEKRRVEQMEKVKKLKSKSSKSGGNKLLTKIKFVHSLKIVEHKIPFKVPMTFVLNLVKAKFKVKSKNQIRLSLVSRDKDTKLEMHTPIRDFSKKVGDFITEQEAEIQVKF